LTARSRRASDEGTGDEARTELEDGVMHRGQVECPFKMQENPLLRCVGGLGRKQGAYSKQKKS
jgi:hypothetical protein